MMEPLGHISEYGLEKLKTRRHYCVSVSHQPEKEYTIGIVRLSDAEARINELEAENAKLKSERLRVDKRIREQRAVLRWWQDHFNMHVSHASRRRLVALGWKWRIIEHYRQMKTVRVKVKDTAAEARAEAAEALLKEAGIEINRLMLFGKRMANVCYNIRQKPKTTAQDHYDLSTAQMEWDEAERAARSLASKIGGGE